MNTSRSILIDSLRAAKTSGKKLLAVLIDPDKFDRSSTSFIKDCEAQGADVLLVGGSLLMHDDLEQCLAAIKKTTSLPVYLFPSSPAQICEAADGILFLSLISGRNADLLIGKQVEAAPILAASSLDVMSTGYMLVDCGNVTTAHYMSQSSPVPYHKPEIAQATALAGQYLGLSCTYMDGGSGAAKPISAEMIRKVSKSTCTPLIVGGGIRTALAAQQACEAGADMIVVGNALESQPELLQDISIAVHTATVKG